MFTATEECIDMPFLVLGHSVEVVGANVQHRDVNISKDFLDTFE